MIDDAHLNADKSGPVEVAEYSVFVMHAAEGRCDSILPAETRVQPHVQPRWSWTKNSVQNRPDRFRVGDHARPAPADQRWSMQSLVVDHAQPWVTSQVFCVRPAQVFSGSGSLVAAVDSDSSDSDSSDSGSVDSGPVESGS